MSKSNQKANQFVLVDQIFQHDEQTLGHVFVFAGKENLPKGVPHDWRYPIDFTQGKAHIRVTVLDKPTDRPVRYMLYLLSGGHGDEYRAVIGTKSVEFSRPGTYEFEEDIRSLFGFENVNWEKPIDEMLVSVWDRHNFPVETRWGHGGKWEGSPNTALYYPMKIHYTVVIVAPSATFKGFPGRLQFLQASLRRMLGHWSRELKGRVKQLLRG